MNKALIASLSPLVLSGCVATSTYTASQKVDSRVAEMSIESLHTALVTADKVQISDVVQSPIAIKSSENQQLLINQDSSVVALGDGLYFANAITLPHDAAELKILSLPVNNKDTATVYLPVVNFYSGSLALTNAVFVSEECEPFGYSLRCAYRIPETADRVLITADYQLDPNSPLDMNQFEMITLNSSHSNSAAYGAGIGVAAVMGGALGGVLAAGLMTASSDEQAQLSLAPGLGGVLSLDFVREEEIEPVDTIPAKDVENENVKSTK